MPSQKGKRAKGVQMTEQQPKILQITQYSVQMPPTQDIGSFTFLTWHVAGSSQ
jgi:hypothetical protein